MQPRNSRKFGLAPVALVVLVAAAAIGLAQPADPPATQPAAAQSNRLTAIHPELACQNLPASMEYYNDVLGFATTFSWGTPVEYAVLQRDGIVIALTRINGNEPPVIGASLFITVADAQAFYEEIEAKNAFVDGPPQQRPWGMLEFAVRDLDGNKLRIGQETQPPAAPKP